MPERPASEPLLALENISAGYPERAVLRGLSIAIAAGELVAILGPNGCGKTTLLRVASGVLAPASGRVLVGGDDLAGLAPRAVAQRVAVLPQDAGPVFSLTSLEAVLLGRHPWHPTFAFESADDVRLARAALDEVDAGHLADRDVLTLSGGERQRVLLARALCQGGELLLCDEPTTHLDLRHQTATFRLLRALARGGRGVVVVTHDLNLAAQACDRLVLLGPEGLVASGTPADVVTAGHLRAAYGIQASVSRTDGHGPYVVRHLEEEGEGR
jgi:ABC-type cobalamin/Fe3+-siderophores transport system ATPase subunit